MKNPNTRVFHQSKNPNPNPNPTPKPKCFWGRTNPVKKRKTQFKVGLQINIRHNEFILKNRQKHETTSFSNKITIKKSENICNNIF